MEFFLLDVKSTISINGRDVAFDYINTYFNLEETITKAKSLENDNNVLSISVHRWILNEDGTQEHAEDRTNNVPYSYTNKNHREWRNFK